MSIRNNRVRMAKISAESGMNVSICICREGKHRHDARSCPKHMTRRAYLRPRSVGHALRSGAGLRHRRGDAVVTP